MYIFLLLLGIIILIIGIYIDRLEIQNNKKPGESFQDDLLERLEKLEEVIFGSNIEVENPINIDYGISEDEFLAILEREKDQVKIDNLDINTDMKEKFKLIADHQRGLYTIEDLCEKLNMQKGEVLLLKNFYKNYQK